MIEVTDPKDPDAVLDYSMDWATWLGSDTLATSVWSVPAGLTKVSDTLTATATIIWLSGGTAGQVHDVRNRITTAGGRTQDDTLRITIRER
jgi:hypothetical protein